MTFSLGRVGLPAASGGDGLTMSEPVTWEQSGEIVTLRGIQSGAGLTGSDSEDHLLWWRDQMLGLAHENGEDAVPVRSTLVANLDGYYRVVDVGVNHPEGSLNGGTLHSTWAIALERMPHWQQPRHELLGAFGQLSNSYGLTGTLVSAVPPNAFDWDFGGDLVTIFTGSTTLRTRSVDNGAGTGVSVNVVTDTAPGTSGTYTGRYLGEIGNHYHGACKIEYDVPANSVWRQVVGYRVFPDAVAVGQMRMSNGLVRVQVTGPGINVSHWDGSQWDPEVSAQLVHVGTATALQPMRAAVLKNTPAVCVVRFYAQLATGSLLSDKPWLIDLSIRRGMRSVFIRSTRSSGTNGQWRLQFAAVTASTSVNSAAIRQTSNNGGGNRVVLVGQDAATQDLVNGRISQAGATTQFIGAVTAEIGGSGAGAGDSAAAQALETFVLASENQRTVAY